MYYHRRGILARHSVIALALSTVILGRQGDKLESHPLIEKEKRKVEPVYT